MKYINYTWKLCIPCKKEIECLPSGSFVYLITVLLKCGDRKLVYIGVSHNLKKRLYNHSILRLFRYNKGEYTVEVLYKTFEGFFSGYQSDNNFMERILISKHPTPYNGHFKPNKKYTKEKLWRDLGIIDIKYTKQNI